ncbi:MAG: hypothetical protein K9H49_14350 [Bacteroidales bacterium]|nr:hypothetical protein [Bacteroidales bacterium]MCF8405615.1 hypothetical protein [Bacteroidales bacterium]
MKIRLVKQRVCYRLTFSGWVLIIGLNSLLVFFTLKYISTFLVVNKPLTTEILVVDGLLPGYAYDSIVKLIKKEDYKYLITTGVDVDYTFNSNEQFNIADFSYKILNTKKIENCQLLSAPAHFIDRDRTYSSAVALREWFITQRIFPGKINVVSFSCHSRRTWVLYRKAFNDFAEVGIISVKDQSYDYARWYYYSRGVRQVLSETIGYVYSIIFFHPKKK